VEAQVLLNQVDPNCSYFHELKVLILISGFMVIKNFQECDFFHSSSSTVPAQKTKKSKYTSVY
jgi:hypothetical protein